jgi:exodeoxyribonuclease V gamma subunit
MPGLHICRSNRLESLADRLTRVIDAPLGDPFAPEIVVVQSLGMRRWIQLELARRTGIAMNIEFPFPAELADRILRATLPDERKTDAFSRDVLPWRVLGAFPRLLDQPAFASLQGYASGEMGPLKEFQLALKVAGLFDRYIAYRPELLLGWQQGRDDDWQAQLWRELARDHRDTNPPALAGRIVAALRAKMFAAPKLPRRVSIFGISSLPPIYLELLNALGVVADVHLFLLEPTADYWADLLTPREREREAHRQRLKNLPEDDEPDLRNDLLASLCKTGRDFSWLLLDRVEAVAEEEAFVVPTEETLLGQLQADIYFQRESEKRRPLIAADRSLQVHCCHGPMRELEVLHDHLLALFAEHPDLTPREVLVTMPDVETYAPFIDAVFGAPESEALRIPYTIADRAARAENSIAAALLQVLDLVGSRFPAPSVLALLDTPAVRERFDLTEADLPLLRDWVERTCIRWGIDAAHRAELKLPPFPQNTWRTGLDRLLLGYALPGDGATLFAGVLPEPGIEGQAALTLGRFVDFTDHLFTRCAGLAAPRPPAAWEQSLRALVEDLFAADDDTADELRRVNSVLEQLGAAAATAEFAAPLEFGVIRAHLSAALADDASSGGFLAGRVTFCALKPMRSIPFRVICMLGLNDNAFPRRDRPLSFDLIAAKPRRGDRSARDDDRYLFLETLFSARETLYLSYCGLSPRDNSESPPSVILAELLDYLARQFELPKDFVLNHRLQPFSAAYFTGENARLFSYSADHAAAARQGAESRHAAPAFAAAPLPAPDPEWQEVSLDQLADFLTKPARYLLKNRLRLRLPEDEQPPADCEPAALDGLTRHQFREVLTHRSITAGRLTADLKAARATGALPPGYAGASEYGTLTREVEQLLARIGRELDAAPLELPPIHLEGDGWRLAGTLPDVRPAGLIRYRAANCKAADQLRAWIAHLALQLTDAPARITTWHSLDTSFRFQPVEDAPAQLAALLALYRRGLGTPLPFFAETALDFATRAINGTGRSDPLFAARQTFEKREAGDAWNQLAFRGVDDLLGGEFAALATEIWAPLFAAKEEL